MHLFRYRLLQTLRERSLVFWSLIFPLILGTFFYLALWNMSNGGAGDEEAAWDVIPVAVVEEGTGTNARIFAQFLEQVDGDLIEIHAYNTDAERSAALASGEITGIYHAADEPYLTVSKSGINQTILKSVLEIYLKDADIVVNVIRDHPLGILAAIQQLFFREEYLSDVDLGGKTMNPMISYFFALIAYGCISGAYLGVQSSFASQANLTALGARRSITPTSKLRLVLTDLAALVLIQFVNISLLTAYVWKVLQIPLGVPVGDMSLTNLMGSVLGVSIGLIIGAVSKAGIGVKTGITVLATLFPAFLAGLMYGNMKNLIEQAAPIVNRLNPAAVLADAYYALSVFNDTARFQKNILILLAMSALLLTIAFLALRRERYDSI